MRPNTSKWWKAPRTTAISEARSGATSFLFRDRAHAGQRLAERLADLTSDPRVIVLALPRGGVPVAFETARKLSAPLDLFLVRKLGVPGQEELAMGAIAMGGVRFLNQEIIRKIHVPHPLVEAATAREQKELDRQNALYRQNRPPPDLRGRVVIIIDDGLATGATMLAALSAARLQEPARLIAAAPIAPPDTIHRLEPAADSVRCVESPGDFCSLSQYHQDFSPTTDEEVHRILNEELRVKNEKV